MSETVQLLFQFREREMGCKSGHPPSSRCNFDITKLPRRPIGIKNVALRNRNNFFTFKNLQIFQNRLNAFTSIKLFKYYILFDIEFWDMTQYNMFDICQNFGETCALIYRKHENTVQRHTFSRGRMFTSPVHCCKKLKPQYKPYRIN